MHKKIALIWVALMMLVMPAIAVAQSKDELKERFAQRYAELLRLRAAGVVGETYLGYVELVKGDSSAEARVRDLVSAENADRRTLYGIIAREQETTPEKVAERNAQRNFANALDGEWLKHSDGVWRQKKR